MDAPLNIALCEDIKDDADTLIRHIDQCGIAVRCDVFSCGEDLLAGFSPGRYDLIFIDIYMGGLSGVETIRKIRESDLKTVVVFTTTSVDHTRDGYRLGAMKYLEKPLAARDVREALRLAAMQRDSVERIALLIGGKHRRIPIDEILYFEQQNHAILVHTAAETMRTSQTMRMDNIERQLLGHTFLRTHKSFLVNMRHISGMDRQFEDFIMVNGDRVLIRAKERKKIQAKYEDYLFEAARESAP